MFPVGTNILYTEEGGISFVKGRLIKHLWLDASFDSLVESAKIIILKEIFNNFRKETTEEFQMKRKESGGWSKYKITHHVSFKIIIESNHQKVVFDTLSKTFKIHDSR